MVHNVISTVGNHNLFSWRKKLFHTCPSVRDEAGAGSGGFKNPGRRRKTDPRHRLAVYVQHHAGGTVNQIMLSGTDMTNPANIPRKSLSSPPFTTKQKLKFWGAFGGCQKKLLDPCFTVRQAIANEGQIASEAVIRVHRIVSLGIKSVVDWETIPGAQIHVLLNYRIAAAVSKDKVVFRNQNAEGITGVIFHPRKSGRGINIPEHDASRSRAAEKNFFFQKFVIRSDPAVLDDEI